MFSTWKKKKKKVSSYIQTVKDFNLLAVHNIQTHFSTYLLLLSDKTGNITANMK